MVVPRRTLMATGCWIASACFWLSAMPGECAPTAHSQLTVCIECHQYKGMLAAQLPLIEGQNAEYLAQELGRFQQAHRKGFPMGVMAGSMSKEDMQTLAAELAARPWDTRPQEIDTVAAKAGVALVSALGCSGCHGPSFRGAGLVPRLAGQNPEYLARQLRAFDSGHRALSLPAAAVSMRGLSTAEIQALAHYLGSLDGQIHLDWLAGHWCRASAKADSEIWWSAPRRGMLIAMQRDLAEADTSSKRFGFIRIEVGDGRAVYYDQPGGRSALSFDLIEAGPQHVIFASSAPQEPRRTLRWQRFDRALHLNMDEGDGAVPLKFKWTADCTALAR